MSPSDRAAFNEEDDRGAVLVLDVGGANAPAEPIKRAVVRAKNFIFIVSYLFVMSNKLIMIYW